MTSLPVPVSPESSTVALVGATASTWERILRKLPWRPTIDSRKESLARSNLRILASSRRPRLVLLVATLRYPSTCVAKLDITLMFYSLIAVASLGNIKTGQPLQFHILKGNARAKKKPHKLLKSVGAEGTGVIPATDVARIRAFRDFLTQGEAEGR